VIDFSVGDPHADTSAGVVAHVSVNGVEQGVLQADYALAKTNCDLHGAVFLTTVGQLTVDSADGTENEIKKLCPGCSLERVDVNPATYATSMQGQVQTTVQRAPKINYLFTTSDIWSPYLIQGTRTLGRDLPFVGGGGSTLAAAIAGSGQTADVRWMPFSLAGYYLADSIMRAVAGHPESRELPMRLMDATNWGASADDSAQFPDLIETKAAIKHAWGVQ
jgi:ABC-type sugar transport system substrate-binding protein